MRQGNCLLRWFGLIAFGSVGHTFILQIIGALFLKITNNTSRTYAFVPCIAFLPLGQRVGGVARAPNHLNLESNSYMSLYFFELPLSKSITMHVDRGTSVVFANIAKCCGLAMVALRAIRLASSLSVLVAILFQHRDQKGWKFYDIA